MPNSAEQGLDRRKAVAALLKDRPENLVVVTGLGSPTYDVAAAGDHPLNFYLWGAMGNAAMIGLGLALAQPERRVLVVTGDGEQLMGLGALASIGVARPRNLAILVLDNERYGETGGQRSHTAAGVSLTEVARACRFAWVESVTDAGDLDSLRDDLLLREGPLLAALKVAPAEQPRVLPERDGAWLRQRFRRALLESGR